MAVRRSSKPTKPEQTTDVFASCSFSSLGLDSAVCDQLRERLAFEAPTQVQAEAIPVILSGRHVLVNASTGSGKTVAYLAPVIHHLQQYSPKIQRSDGTFALVLVPTHELCLQVYEILQKLLHRFHWIVPGYVKGGESKQKEKARLRKGISILVATPGRLLDHLKMTSSFVHSNLRWIIFDEADRILEQGYGKAIEEIINILGSRADKSVSKGSAVSSKYKFERQNLLLSATLNEKVNHLAKISLENPAMIGMDDKRKESAASHVYLGDGDDTERRVTTIPSDMDYNLPSQLNQKFVKVTCNSRLAVLLSIIKHLYEREASQKVVVFFSTCDAVDFHYKLLSDFQFTPMSKPEAEPESEVKHSFVESQILRLHGNMNQEDRKATFMAFKTEECALLLSTDIAARGLDFPKVRCIIQYDSPGDASEYVHRVGRTARLGERGESLLFLQPIESDYLKDLEKHNVALTEFKLSKVLDSFPFYEDKNRVKKFVPTDSHPWIMALQKALESYVASQMKVKNLAQRAYCSWIRAYTAHRGELKRIFMVKKLHLGHVAKSFALKEQPSLVVKSALKQEKKRKTREEQNGPQKKRKTGEGHNGPQKQRRVAGKTR